MKAVGAKQCEKYAFKVKVSPSLLSYCQKFPIIANIDSNHVSIRNLKMGKPALTSTPFTSIQNSDLERKIMDINKHLNTNLPEGSNSQEMTFAFEEDVNAFSTANDVQIGKEITFK